MLQKLIKNKNKNKRGNRLPLSFPVFPLWFITAPLGNKVMHFFCVAFATIFTLQKKSLSPVVFRTISAGFQLTGQISPLLLTKLKSCDFFCVQDFFCKHGLTRPPHPYM
jgi:hypothetical protein